MQRMQLKASFDRHLTASLFSLPQSEVESEVYDKLASMLQCMEAHEQNTDVDRVNELIKVNIIVSNKLYPF